MDQNAASNKLENTPNYSNKVIEDDSIIFSFYDSNGEVNLTRYKPPMLNKLKKFIIVIIGIVLMMLSITVVKNYVHAKTLEQMSAIELLDFGEKYLLEMNYEQAVVYFLTVIEIEPMNPRGYTGAAEAYVGLEQLDNAISVLQDGLKILPNNIEIQVKLDEIKAMLGEIQKKSNEFSQTAELIEINENSSTNTTLEDSLANEDIMYAMFESEFLIPCEEFTFFGVNLDSTMKGDGNNFASILESNGFTSNANEHLNADWDPLNTGWNHHDGCSSISVGDNQDSRWVSIENVSRGLKIDTGDLKIGIGEIRTSDSMSSFLSKFGFTNAEQIAEFISSYAEISYDSYLNFQIDMCNYNIRVRQDAVAVQRSNDDVFVDNKHCEIAFIPQNNPKVSLSFIFYDNTFLHYRILYYKNIE